MKCNGERERESVGESREKEQKREECESCKRHRNAVDLIKTQTKQTGDEAIAHLDWNRGEGGNG
jgi:hypothetical protein